jgi:hypothetical protein
MLADYVKRRGGGGDDDVDQQEDVKGSGPVSVEVQCKFADYQAAGNGESRPAIPS